MFFTIVRCNLSFTKQQQVLIKRMSNAFNVCSLNNAQEKLFLLPSQKNYNSSTKIHYYSCISYMLAG